MRVGWWAGRTAGVAVAGLFLFGGCGGNTPAAALPTPVADAAPLAAPVDAMPVADTAGAELPAARPSDAPAESPPADAALAPADAAAPPADATSATAADAGPDAPPSAGESIAVVSACEIPPMALPPEINLATDVSYYAPAGQEQRLDVAWPKSAGPHPLVVFIHGGGWAAGDKMQHRPAMHRLAGQGYVAATINHRLATATTNNFPAAVQDVRCAIRWLRARATTYAIDPARVAVVGTSAGAHLAAMIGTAPSAPSLDSPDCPATRPATVRATVGYYGVYDLRLLAGLPGGQVAVFLGTSNPEVASLASPIVHVDATDSPFLLVHGTADNMVPPLFSQWMKSALQAGGVPVTLVEESGAPHGFDVFDPKYPTSTCTTLAFLRAELAP